MPAKPTSTKKSASKAMKSPAKKSSVAKAAKNQKKEIMSQSARAQLLVPVAKVMRLMKQDRLNVRVSRKAGLMMAAVLEYLMAELFESSGNFTMQKNKKRINNRHIQLALQTDEEFQKLLQGSIIHQGGVLPHIEPALLPKKKAKAGEAMANPSQEI